MARLNIQSADLMGLWLATVYENSLVGASALLSMPTWPIFRAESRNWTGTKKAGPFPSESWNARVGIKLSGWETTVGNVGGAIRSKTR